MKKNKIIRFVFFAIAVLLSSCVAQKNVKILQGSQQEGEKFSTPTMEAYQVQPGDYIYIKVYSVDPKTSKFFQSDFPQLFNNTYVYLNSYMIDEQGYISFSFIEKILVKGLTINELRDKLQKKLDDFFNESKVIVKLVNFDVTVLGEVNTPGTFKIDKDDINILQVIGMAGGTTSFTNLKKVKIIRRTVEGSKIISIDLSSNQALASANYKLLPNDIIYLEPRNSKSWAMEKLPYYSIISTIALVLSIVSFL